MTSPRHAILAGTALVALLGSAAACSNGRSGTAAGPAGAGTAKTATTTSAKKIAVDACTLLKNDEVEGIIGANGGGHVGAGIGESICEWDNEDTYHSITVSIGNKNTAAGGKLAADKVAGPGEPGPDGIRFATDNTATFVAADRECYVQVVTDPTSKKDRDIAVRLVRLVRARTSGKL